jgi:hypothetical protein
MYVTYLGMADARFRIQNLQQREKKTSHSEIDGKAVATVSVMGETTQILLRVLMVITSWLTQPLLGNDSEISKYTTVVAK